MSTMIANRLNTIQPSITITLSAKARDMRAAGKDVIDLGIGEPDFDTPDHIKEGAIKAIMEGKTKYTAVAGTNELKEAIIQKFKNDNNVNYDKSNIIVSSGAKHSLFNLFMATLNESDEVIIPTPYWVSYPDMVKMAGGEPVIVKTDASLKLKPSDLEGKITARTKWITMNSPSNPSGVIYTREDLEKLFKFLKSYPNVGIIDDAIYEHITYDETNPYISVAEVAESYDNSLSKVFTINGISKAYAMTGWRIGYGAGTTEIVKAMSTIQSQSTSNPCSISQAAAFVALTSSHEFLKERNIEFKKRRDYFLTELSNINDIVCNTPGGAFYLFPNCSRLYNKTTSEGNVINSDLDFCKYLLEEKNVLTVPGSAFGCPGFFRISYALSLDSITIACQRIREFCEQCS